MFRNLSLLLKINAAQYVSVTQTLKSMDDVEYNSMTIQITSFAVQRRFFRQLMQLCLLPLAYMLHQYSQHVSMNQILLPQFGSPPNISTQHHIKLFEASDFSVMKTSTCRARNIRQHVMCHINSDEKETSLSRIMMFILHATVAAS